MKVQNEIYHLVEFKQPATPCKTAGSKGSGVRVNPRLYPSSILRTLEPRLLIAHYEPTIQRKEASEKDSTFLSHH